MTSLNNTWSKWLLWSEANPLISDAEAEDFLFYLSFQEVIVSDENFFLKVGHPLRIKYSWTTSEHYQVIVRSGLKYDPWPGQVFDGTSGQQTDKTAQKDDKRSPIPLSFLSMGTALKNSLSVYLVPIAGPCSDRRTDDAYKYCVSISNPRTECYAISCLLSLNKLSVEWITSAFLFWH